MSYQFLQKFGPAIQDYTKVIALEPKPEASHFNARGAAYTAAGQYQQAISDFDRAITLEPTSVTYNNRGYCYFLLGQFKRAIEDYDRAIAMAPKSAGVLYMRGIAKLRSDDKTGGNADIAAAVALEPKIAEQFAAAGVKP
jgi:tetratricopeptide (TPR) repeat protein